jgi:hypothetical protein
LFDAALSSEGLHGSDIRSVDPSAAINGALETYSPSVDSRTACSRLTLQTQDLGAPKLDLAAIWGELWGYSHLRSRQLEAISILVIPDARRGVAAAQGQPTGQPD